MKIVNNKKPKTNDDVEAFISNITASIINNKNEEITPVKYSDKQKAMIINALYRHRFYDTYKYEYLGKKLITEAVKMFSMEKGVKPPELTVMIDHSKKYGGASNMNTLLIIGKGEKEKFGISFPQLINILAHEIQHIYQNTQIKKVFKMGKSEIRYIVMATLQVPFFLRAETADYKDESERVVDYLFSAHELDARIETCEYFIDLLENEYIDKNAKLAIAKFLLDDYMNQIHLESVGSLFLDRARKNNKHLIKKYGHTDIGNSLNTFYKTTQEYRLSFADALNEYEATYRERVYEAVMDCKEIDCLDMKLGANVPLTDLGLKILSKSLTLNGEKNETTKQQ